MKNELEYRLVKKEDFGLLDFDRMYELMSNNYNHVNKENFEKDLLAKQYVGIFTLENIIYGFTTYAINPQNSGTDEYNIVFSGDTIIDPEFWGTQIMMQSWCRTVGTFLHHSSSKKLYWYLLTKGHRTYMYLPLFFSDYFPSHEGTKDPLYQSIAERCSDLFYGEKYKIEKGVIQFKEKIGELNKELAEASFNKRSTFAAFFLEKNPGFYNGDELVCLTEISVDNMIRSGKKYLIDGLENPLF